MLKVNQVVVPTGATHIDQSGRYVSDKGDKMQDGVLVYHVWDSFWSVWIVQFGTHSAKITL